MKLPPERDVPKRHRIAVTWVGIAPARLALRQTVYCGACDKLALHSAEAARSYIALIIRAPQFKPRQDDYTFAPYPCPHLDGMWHVGHDYSVVELLGPGKQRPLAGALLKGAVK